MAKRLPPLTRPDRLRVAAAVDVDPRTVTKLLRGERVHPAIAQAIRSAMVELGLGGVRTTAAP